MAHKFKATFRNLITLLLAGCLLAVNAGAARAQSGTGAWDEVINKDGSIRYDNLTDGGVTTQPADWMPDIPSIGSIPAEYHIYYTPSGNTVVLPTASTLFFMVASSGSTPFSTAASSMGNASIFMAGLLAHIASNPASLISLTAAAAQMGYDNPQTFFADVAAGKANIWSLNPTGMWNFLSGLFGTSMKDQSLYTMMLLFTPDQCATAPGGCSAEQLALIAKLHPTATPPPPPGTCPDPVVKPGAVSGGGQDTWPPYPLVVGQDPDKNGVNLSFHASVSPTIYTSWTPEPIGECKSGPNANGVYNCGGGTGHKVITGYSCVQHTQTYNECIDFATGTTSLSKESQDWIQTGQLQILYPGAYIHHGSFSFGGSGCSWSASQMNAQIEDPGNWNISVHGRTSGTPVSAPRNFNIAGTSFTVWLKEVMIVK